jgi:hypothetical protein
MAAFQSSLSGSHQAGQVARLEAQLATLTSELQRLSRELQQSKENLQQQQQQSAIALQEKDEWLTDCLEAAEMAAWEYNLQTKENRLSKQLEALYGFEPGEYNETLEAFFSRIHPDDREMIRCKDEEALQTGRFEAEFRIVHPNGTIRWIAAKAKVFYDEQGVPLRMSGVDRDITGQKRTEAALRRAHQQLAFHVENSPLAVVEWDGQFRVQYWSTRAEELFGWPATEVLRCHPFEWKFFEEQNRQQVEEFMAALASGQAVRSSCYTQNYTKAGNLIDCEWYNSALSDENGTLISILSLVLDVTERKQAEEAKQRSLSLLETTLEATADGILVFNPTGQITHVNQRFVEQWRVPNSVMALRHQQPLLQFQQAQLKNPEAAIEPVSPEQECPGQENYVLLELKDGRVFERYSKPQILAGTTVGQVVSYRDITAHKQAETSLREQALQARALNQLKDDFLSTVSHELRSPITNIKMAAQMLAIALGPAQQDERISRYLCILQEQCQQEMELINNLLDLQSLEREERALQLKSICLQNWLVEIVEPFLARTGQQQQLLHLDVPSTLPQFVSDPNLLWRILTELLNNACKYTPPGEKISLTVDCHEQTLLLQISNSGVEIPAESLPHVFGHC